jgi:hypothetical protein
MNVIRPTTPYGYSIFCDDIRVEGNGKQLFIGVYTVDMLMPQFPAQMPSFHILIRYNERPNESTLPVKFVITMPGQEEPIFTNEISREQLTATIMPTSTEELDDPMVTLNIVAVFHGLVFAGPGRMKVRAYRGDDEIRLGTLGVRLHPDLEAAPTEAAN